jgi:hypothetical protein
VAESLRHTIRTALESLYQRDAERLLSRVKLSAGHAELRAREATYRTAGSDVLAAQLASRRGMPSDDPESESSWKRSSPTSVVAIDRWQHDDARSDLLELFDEAIDVLITTTAELNQPPRVARIQARSARNRRRVIVPRWQPRS